MRCLRPRRVMRSGSGMAKGDFVHNALMQVRASARTKVSSCCDSRSILLSMAQDGVRFGLIELGKRCECEMGNSGSMLITYAPFVGCS